MQVIDVIDIIDVTDIDVVDEVTATRSDSAVPRRRPVLPPASRGMAQVEASTAHSHSADSHRLGALAAVGVVLAALLLVAALVGNALVRLFDVPSSPWLAALVETGPILAAICGAVATAVGYAATRHADPRHARHTDLHGAAAPVWQVAMATVLLVASLAVSGLTLAPAPFHVLGTIAASSATTNGSTEPNSGGTNGQPGGTTASVTPTPTPITTPTATPTPAPHLAVAFGATKLRQTCRSFYAALPPVTVTLDNSASNVAAQWQVQAVQLIPGTPHPWASTAQSGVAPAGQQVTLTFTPHPKLCYWSPLPAKIYHLTVLITGGPSVTVTDTITSPPLK